MLSIDINPNANLYIIKLNGNIDYLQQDSVQITVQPKLTAQVYFCNKKKL